MNFDSDFETKVVEDQKIEPYEQCVEAVHVTISNGSGCGQAYCNTCNQDICLYIGYHYARLESWQEKPTQKNPMCYQVTEADSKWRRYC